MPDDRLSVAIIGAGGTGNAILQALLQTGLVNIAGIADRDPAIAEQTARKCSLPAYSDNRRLLAETQPQAVFLAVPPMDAPDTIAACAERGIHVWKQPPLARRLDEGLTLTRRMEDAGLKLAVGTQRRFSSGYRTAFRLRDRIGDILLARAHYLFNWGPDLGWRGDRASTGGGALMQVGYHHVDLLVWLLGLPEAVCGLDVCGCRPGRTSPTGDSLPVYDTDDAAAALLRFPAGCAAVLAASRQSGPVSEEVSLHGSDGSILATSESCLLRDPDGNILDRNDAEDSPTDVYRRQTESFVRAILTGTAAYHCSGRENLLNLAVIEAAYLSSRTGQPESPLRLLRARELDEASCLACRPDETPT